MMYRGRILLHRSRCRRWQVMPWRLLGSGQRLRSHRGCRTSARQLAAHIPDGAGCGGPGLVGLPRCATPRPVVPHAVRRPTKSPAKRGSSCSMRSAINPAFSSRRGSSPPAPPSGQSLNRPCSTIAAFTSLTGLPRTTLCAPGRRRSSHLKKTNSNEKVVSPPRTTVSIISCSDAERSRSSILHPRSSILDQIPVVIPTGLW